MAYAYNFELYTGVPNNGEPHLKSSANIVVRLLRYVPEFRVCKLEGEPEKKYK